MANNELLKFFASRGLSPQSVMKYVNSLGYSTQDVNNFLKTHNTGEVIDFISKKHFTPANPTYYSNKEDLTNALSLRGYTPETVNNYLQKQGYTDQDVNNYLKTHTVDEINQLPILNRPKIGRHDGWTAGSVIGDLVTRRGEDRLDRLKGFNDLGEDEQQQFYLRNADKLKVFDKFPEMKQQAAEALYENQKFADVFGEDGLKAFNNGQPWAYAYRQQMLRHKIIQDAFENRYSPYDTAGNRDDSKGMGADWDKYNQLSDDSKLKLMQSGWQTNAEFEKNHPTDAKYWTVVVGDAYINKGETTGDKLVNAGLEALEDDDFELGVFNDGYSRESMSSRAINAMETAKTARRYDKEKNDKIIENIWGEESDKIVQQDAVQEEVDKQQDGIKDIKDDDIESYFYKLITPGGLTDENGMPNPGISAYAAAFGPKGEGFRNTSGKMTGASTEVSDFSINDMREVIAKYHAYKKLGISPEMAATALNREAQRYIHDHQPFMKKAAMFGKDVLISATSYTVDKADGFLSMMTPIYSGKSDVWVNEKGEVVDPVKNKIIMSPNGNAAYVDGDGNIQYVKKQAIDKIALHQMGRNMDGSENEGILNPQYWSKAEQYSTTDHDMIEQFDKLGASPYKVAYGPDKDSDFMYEAFKMMSFGIADGAALALPYGIGQFGRWVSKAKSLAKLGELISFIGEGLSSNTTTGQVIQGALSAQGIANAYQRGQFAEDLQRNLLSLESKTLQDSRGVIRDLYNSDEKYRKDIDARIEAKIAKMRAEMASQGEERKKLGFSYETPKDDIRAFAEQEVINEEVSKEYERRKSTEDYMNGIQEAMNTSAASALLTMAGEAIKYGIVNTIGFRKWMFQNKMGPAGVAAEKFKKFFKNVGNVTTKEGRQRLVQKTWDNLTSKEKWAKFGKIVGKQAWGGAWTNGTDDMMVDAAEQVSEDSFNHYLNGHNSADAMSDLYGYADGFFSYMSGLADSMGQETTVNAAGVGGVGSLVSFTPNVANILHLLTKQGRQEYRDNFKRRLVRDEYTVPSEDKTEIITGEDENGNPTIEEKPVDEKYVGQAIKDENGNPQYEKIGWGENWRERLAYFINNGVLQEYYGERQNARSLQRRLDFVNGLMDETNDFKALEDLVESDYANQNSLSKKDDLTTSFINALNVLKSLESLGRDKKDPSVMSSVVQKAKQQLELAAKLNTEKGRQAMDEAMGEGAVKNMLTEYYAKNPSIAQSEEANERALQVMAQNAQKLQEASKLYDKAEEEIAKKEKSLGISINPSVRNRMKLYKSLIPHWEQRLGKMKEELGDDVAADAEIPVDAILPSVGGRKQAKGLLKVYDRQEKELNEALENQRKKVSELKEQLDTAQETLETAPDEVKYSAQKAYAEARASYEEAQMNETYFSELIERTKDKRGQIEQALAVRGERDAIIDEQTQLSNLKEKARQAREEAKEARRKVQELGPVKSGSSKKDKQKRAAAKELQTKLALAEKAEQEYNDALAQAKKENAAERREKVLTADEIFNLNPVVRARMLNPQNREIYSKRQQKEIVKLEKELLKKDPDALQKVQDIASLHQSIATIEDAYYKISENPEAAAVRLDVERNNALNDAYDLLNQKQAADIASQVKDWVRFGRMYPKLVEQIIQQRGLNTTPEEFVDNQVYTILKASHPRILDIIKRDRMLPRYKALDDAIEWSKIFYDIRGVIRNLDMAPERKQMLLNTVMSQIEKTRTQKEVMDILEKVARDTERTITAQDYNSILEGLEKLKYQRSSVTVETTEEKEAREQAEQAKLKKEQEELAEVLKDVEEEQKKKGEEEEQKGEGEVPPADENYVEPEGDVEAAVENAEDIPLSIPGSIWEEAGQEEKPGEVVENSRTEAEALEELVAYFTMPGVKNINSLRDALKGTKYTHIVPGPMKDSQVWELNWDAIEKDLGKYLKDKYPQVVIVDNGERLLYVTDKKGYEYGSPSNVLEQYSKGNQRFVNFLEGEKESKQDKEIPPTQEQQQEEQLEQSEKQTSEDKGNKEGGVAVKTTEEEGNPAEEENKETPETENPSEVQPSYMDSNAQIVEKDGTVGIRSATAEEQADEEIGSGATDIEVTDTTAMEDADANNGVGEHAIEVSATTLSGNKMEEYVVQLLIEDGILQRKKGTKEGDEMNRYFAWMDSMGIKLQNIIDHELAGILANNPHAKIKFMAVAPKMNATNDVDMKTSLLLVLDYDNKINKGITAIHNKDNGGVLSSQGKDYLVVGVLGYGSMDTAKNNGQLDLYNILFSNDPNRGHGYGLVKKKIGAKWPERFMIAEGLSTEIVENSLVPGYRVKQLKSQESPNTRSVLELLDNPESNPYGLTLETLKWGIQERTTFVAIGVPQSKVMKPVNTDANAGTAFVLVPASNGKYLPLHINALKYAEMKNGTLKTRVDNLLMQVTAPRFEQRLAAIKELQKIFHWERDGGDTIWLRPGNVVALQHNGEEFASFTLDENFDRAAFMKSVEDMNPRINITASVLRNKTSIKEYAEAGALDTDAAMLGTAGSFFRVYGLDANGNILSTNVPNNTAEARPSDYRNDKRMSVIYRGAHYTYNKENGTFTLNGEQITNPQLLKELQYNQRVVENGLLPALTSGVWEYYVLDSGENTSVIKINRNTKQVQEIEGEQAKKVIQKIAEEKAAKIREQNAKSEMEKKAQELDDAEVDLDNAEDIDLGIDFEATDDGLLAPAEEAGEEEKGKEGENKEKSPAPETPVSPTKAPAVSSEASKPSSTILSFSEAVKLRNFRKPLTRIIKEKWPGAPTKTAELENFLKEKGMDTDAIGSSETAMQAWLKTLEDCR